MDPSGGLFFVILIIILAILLGAWVLAPFAVALGLTVGLGVMFFGLVLYVASQARYD